MATYLVLAHFTEQGVKNIKDSPKRASNAAAMAKKLGVKMKEVYWTLGAYDAAVVVEAPDDETITAWSLSMGALGFIKTETLRAFPAKEFATILEKMS
jgi:uncharacterized protein with GYD domain